MQGTLRILFLLDELDVHRTCCASALSPVLCLSQEWEVYKGPVT